MDLSKDFWYACVIMIGQLRETALHESLKQMYAEQTQGVIEESVDGYIIDVVTPLELIEIQTGNFSNIRVKLDKLLSNHRVRVVYPISVEKTIRLYDQDLKNILRERKSPAKGVPAAAGVELMRIPETVLHPNFILEIVMVKVLEERADDGEGSWRRKGISILGRTLLEVIDTIIFEGKESYKLLLPANLPERFTHKDLIACAGITPGQAAKLSWFLRKIGVVHEAGKQERSLLLEIVK
ncbi:MAG: hypothetical protein HQ557_00620 [Bacteroidetes bacterium]|nr:hypothetical protein [Bacteroidota bacterium]